MKKHRAKHLVSVPYHRQTNGLVESLNATPVDTIRTYVHAHAALPHLLFAYRTVPQRSLGVSPFKLVYSRQARTPVSLVKNQ